MNRTDLNFSNPYPIANKLVVSSNFIHYTFKINICAMIAIVSIGLIGHILTICVYSQKKFRRNFSHIYIYCLSINDGLFLLVHFFEDVIIKLKEQDESNYNPILEFFNLIDRFEFACYLITYSYNVLRFNSAYIIIAFTIQRLFIVYKPLSILFRSKKSAWKSVLFITFTSMIVNSWSFFLIELKKEGSKQYCTLIRELGFEYLIANTVYVVLVSVLSITIISVCNFLIILKTISDDSKRKKMQPNIHRASLATVKSIKSVNNRNLSNVRFSIKSVSTKFLLSINNFYSRNQSIAGLKRKYNENNQTFTKKITKKLMLISSLYVILNLPYLITWFIYYHLNFQNRIGLVTGDYLLAYLQITNILRILNYGISFFLYCF